MPELRPYQQEDVAFLSRLSAAACFNEQRTGKTPIALRACLARGCTKILIVCPASVVFQWVEAYRHWTGDTCLAAVGPAAKRRAVYQRWDRGGLVVAYSVVRADNGRADGDLALLLKSGFDGMVLDEAHRIKSRKTTATKVFKLGRGAAYRLALTGTPAPNRAHDVWAILHFLYPKTFASYWNFVERYCVVTEERGQGGRTYKDVQGYTAFGEQQMTSALSQIATQRKRQDVMPWMPAKDIVTVSLPADNIQARHLDRLAEFWETEHVVTQGTLDRLIRYRQICLDPALLGLKGQSPKTQFILDYLADYPERPLLVFSKFTGYLKLLSQHLTTARICHGLIIGDTSLPERAAIVDRFQSGGLDVLLLNIDAGKEGLTLDRAEVEIFTDRFPPVGDLAQAEDRFVATTEARADKLHLIYYLQIKDSYDEEINQMIADRVSETDIINDFAHYKERRST